MHIIKKQNRHGTFYVVCTASGAEYMVFKNEARAIAWFNNEIYA